MENGEERSDVSETRASLGKRVGEVMVGSNLPRSKICCYTDVIYIERGSHIIMIVTSNVQEQNSDFLV